jgi:hypothetical protein
VVLGGRPSPRRSRLDGRTRGYLFGIRRARIDRLVGRSFGRACLCGRRGQDGYRIERGRGTQGRRKGSAGTWDRRGAARLEACHSRTTPCHARIDAAPPPCRAASRHWPDVPRQRRGDPAMAATANRSDGRAVVPLRYPHGDYAESKRCLFASSPASPERGSCSLSRRRDTIRERFGLNNSRRVGGQVIEERCPNERRKSRQAGATPRRDRPGARATPRGGGTATQPAGSYALAPRSASHSS